jgi:hypothetical protein
MAVLWIGVFILIIVIVLNISRFEMVSTSVLSTWYEVKSEEGIMKK